MSIESQVQQLYVAYFNRPADTAGLNYWTAVVTAAGGSTTAVSAAFSQSAEYKAAYAGLSSTLIVDTVYQNLFGRHAEAGGLQYWALLLDQGAITVSNVVTQIAAGAQGTDATAYNNKTLAAVDFTRGLDTGDEIRGYDGTGPNGATVLALAKAYITGVTDDASLAAARAGLDATITGIQTAHEVVAPITVALTTGIDTVAPSTAQPMTGNDTINAYNTAATQSLSSFDKIDGGAGTDTLNVVSVGNAFDDTTTSGMVIKNIEHAVVTSDRKVVLHTTGWTGLADVTVTAAGATSGSTTVNADATTAVTVTNTNSGGNSTVVNGGSAVSVTANDASGGGTIAIGSTAAPGGAITVTSNNTASNVTSGSINVKGGTTIAITQAQFNNVNSTNTNGVVTVVGGASTTSVSVTSAAKATASATVAGVTANAVSISDVNAGADAAGKITSATVSNFTALSINDNALTSLTVAGGSGNIIIDNSGLTTATNKTLALSVNGQTGGTLDDADIYTTLNVTTTGANSTLANITTGALTALTVAGTKVLTLTSTAGLSALKTVTVSGSAGVKADLSGATVTSVDASATSGANTVTIDASKAAFTGGSGVDTVTLAATTPSKAVSLGAGDDSLNLGALAAAPTGTLDAGTGTDNLTMTAALAATASADAKFAGVVKNFEKVTLTGATNQTVDLAVLGNFTYVTTSGGNGLVLSNLNTGGTLALNGAGTAYTIDHNPSVVTTTDVLNLVLSADASAAGTNFAATGITANNAGTINISTVDTEATPAGAHDHLVSLLGNVAKSIVVSGNNGLTLTATDTAATNVDASGITLGGFTYVSGALAAAATIKGSATGDNAVNFSAATKGVTYTGGTGVDTIVSNVANGTIDLGSGTTKNVVTGGATGNHTVNSTATDTVVGDSVTLGSGNNIVSLGNGTNIFIATSGNNTYTGGTGVDTVTLGGGINTVSTGTGADVITFTAPSANGNSYSSVTDFHTGASLVLGGVAGTSTFTSTKITFSNGGENAVFQDYLDAGAAASNAAANSHFSWFQLGGNTYVVLDNSNAVTFQSGVDSVVKLVGTLDLSTATFAAVAATSGSLTLA